MAAEGPTAEAVPPQAPSRRLFFALWPDEDMRQAMLHAIRKAARASGGRPVPAANLHVTLAFLGAVPERRLGELGETARAAAAPGPTAAGANPPGRPPSPAGTSEDSPASRLELAFDHLEYWRGAQLLCALPAEPPAPVSAFARKLQDLLAGRGFAPDLKSSWSVELNISRPFRPHVTLARNIHRSPRVMDMDPATWSFADFVLMDSKTLPEGSVYTVLERFPFCH